MKSYFSGELEMHFDELIQRHQWNYYTNLADLDNAALLYQKTKDEDVYKLVKKHYERKFKYAAKDRHDSESLVQEMDIILYKTLLNYNASSRFNTFLWVAIKRLIGCTIRYENTKKETLNNKSKSLNAPISSEDSRELVETVTLNIKFEESSVFNTDYEYFTKDMKQKDKFVLDAYVHGYTLTEIAKALKLTPEAIYIRIKRMRSKYPQLENIAKG